MDAKNYTGNNQIHLGGVFGSKGGRHLLTKRGICLNHRNTGKTKISKGVKGGNSENDHGVSALGGWRGLPF